MGNDDKFSMKPILSMIGLPFTNEQREWYCLPSNEEVAAERKAIEAQHAAQAPTMDNILRRLDDLSTQLAEMEERLK